MKIIKQYKQLSKEKRSVVNTFLVFCASVIWSLIKMIIGICEHSKFLIASSLFTMCLALSKGLCLVGIVKHKKQYVIKTHVWSSLLIVFGGIFYGLYNTRLLTLDSSTSYGLIPSITIAAVSFFLLIKAIVYLFKDRKRDEYHRNLRVIAVIGGLMDIVMTQMCLLAVKAPDMDQAYNSYIALGVSTLTVILGLFCLVYPLIHKKRYSKDNFTTK